MRRERKRLEQIEYEGEHDLSLMVTEFLESNGSGGSAESWFSSDSDGGPPDIPFLIDKIQFYISSASEEEYQLRSVVHSLLLSIKAKDLHFVKSGTCNASCLRFYLAKLLRLSGRDSGVCVARWQGSGKVPGGDHEYIDVIDSKEDGTDERMIIDLDFRSHFEIARAVDSYRRLWNSLPVIYVGSLSRLKCFLEVMVEAARCSLKQNSMPLPPWRSVAYLEAKWQSPYRRHTNPIEQNLTDIFQSEHTKCSDHLKQLQSVIPAKAEMERSLKLACDDIKWKSRYDGAKHSLPRALYIYNPGAKFR